MSNLKLWAFLGLDKTGFDAGMAAAGKQANKFGKDLKSSLAGGFGAVAMVAFTREVLNAADATDELQERLKVSNREAQEFALASKLGGSDSEFFAAKFEKLRKVLNDSAGKGLNPLEAFGIAATKDPAHAMRELARVIDEVGLNSEQSARFVEIFGKGSGRLVNVLGDLKNAKTGTLFFNDHDVQKLREANDALTKLGHNAKVLFASVLTAQRGLVPNILSVMGFHQASAFAALTGLGNASGKKGNTLDESGGLAKEQEARVAAMVKERTIRLEEAAAILMEKNRIATISKEERINELAIEREKIFKRVATTEEERAMKTLALAKNESELIALSGSPEDQKSQEEKARRGFSITETAFGRIGAFTGASAGAALTPGQAQQIQQLQKIADALLVRGITVRDVR